MSKHSYNITDDNYKILKQLADDYGLDMTSIVNLSIATLKQNEEEKEELKNLKISVRSNEKKLNILYSALNNFFLNFAPNMEDYVQPYISEHTWLKQATKDEESRIQMKSHNKKWTGNNPKPPDEKQ